MGICGSGESVQTGNHSGRDTVGFCSLSNYLACGTLTGALPSDRLRGKALTPGLTPEPTCRCWRQR